MPRTEVAAVVQVGLDFVAQARAEGQALADADVVLHVTAVWALKYVDQRVADALRVGGGRARVEGIQAREREGAEPVRRVVRAVVAAGREEPGPHGVQAAHVVHVGRRLEGPRMPSARHLRAAAGERAVDDDVRASVADTASESCHSSCSRVLANVRRPSGPTTCARNSWSCDVVE